MGANSAIQWCDHTFNPWEGCAKVAPECKNCYAETLSDHRFGRVKWGKGQPRRRTSANLWKQVLKWNQFYYPVCDNCGTEYAPRHIESCNVECSGCGGALRWRRPRVFCLSLGDWLDEEVPSEWLADLLVLIHATQNLDWLLLTKRPQNFIPRMIEIRNSNATLENITGCELAMDWRNGMWPLNVWIGVSAGADQGAALDIPAKIHFLSCEPMLHAMDERKTAQFDWIIFGGESGRNARPCHLDWLRAGIAFCRANSIATFVKQLGRVAVFSQTSDAETMRKLHDSHGGDMAEWPEDLRVREFPEMLP